MIRAVTGKRSKIAPAENAGCTYTGCMKLVFISFNSVKLSKLK